MSIVITDELLKNAKTIKNDNFRFFQQKSLVGQKMS